MKNPAIWLRRVLTTGLTIIAFANSFAHTKDWFSDHGQEAQAGWLAAIPEVGVILVVLTLAAGGLSKSVQWLISAIGIGSLGITFTANIAGASAGWMGFIAALVAPVFAVLGFALEVVSLSRELETEAHEPVSEPAPAGDEPTIVVQVQPVVEPEPVVVIPPAEPKKAQRKPVSRPAGGVVDAGIIWATELTADGSPWPTVSQIRAQFPEMSPASVKRVRAANPAGTDGTAKIRESVNA